MDDEAMRWTMRRCYGAMRWSYVTIAPSHRRIVHRIASSSIASSIASPHSIASSSIASPHRPSPHRPSHRLIVHRIASSSSRRRNASVSLLGHHRKATNGVDDKYHRMDVNETRRPRETGSRSRAMDHDSQRHLMVMRNNTTNCKWVFVRKSVILAFQYLQNSKGS